MRAAVHRSFEPASQVAPGGVYWSVRRIDVGCDVACVDSERGANELAAAINAAETDEAAAHATRMWHAGGAS